MARYRVSEKPLCADGRPSTLARPTPSLLALLKPICSPLTNLEQKRHYLISNLKEPDTSEIGFCVNYSSLLTKLALAYQLRDQY